MMFLLNILGGRGLIPHGRVIFRMVLMPLYAAWILGFSWYTLAVCLAGFALWAVFGWGKYFAAFHGRYDAEEKEIGWIDWLGDEFFPYQDKQTNLDRGVFCMGFRGLFLWPMFILLIPVNPYAALLGFFMVLQGACYGVARFVPERYSVIIGEGLTGLLIEILLRLL